MNINNRVDIKSYITQMLHLATDLHEHDIKLIADKFDCRVTFVVDMAYICLSSVIYTSRLLLYSFN